jgi:hypothetical protein
MTDEPQPPPVFPQYEPPDPRGPQFAHPKQARPLWKMVNKLFKPRPRQRTVKNKSLKRKKREVA